MIEWISVDDEMPEEGSRVLVWQVFDDFGAGCESICELQDGKFIGWLNQPLRKATHWMPLPGGPK